jgi:hypothetical protein
MLEYRTTNDCGLDKEKERERNRLKKGDKNTKGTVRKKDELFSLSFLKRHARLIIMHRDDYEVC